MSQMSMASEPVVPFNPIDQLTKDISMLRDDSLNMLIDEELNWEDELDMIGAGAQEDELRSMLQKAPNQQSDKALFLSEYLNGLVAARLSSITY